MRDIIESGYAARVDQPDTELREAMTAFLIALNTGELRAAEPAATAWKVNEWVKKGILLLFRYGVITDMSINSEFRFSIKLQFP